MGVWPHFTKNVSIFLLDACYPYVQGEFFMLGIRGFRVSFSCLVSVCSERIFRPWHPCVQSEFLMLGIRLFRGNFLWLVSVCSE